MPRSVTADGHLFALSASAGAHYHHACPITYTPRPLTARATSPWMHAVAATCQQIKQYRGLPFKTKARGIFNATGLNEGIVLVRAG